jgi:polyhydroxyalkanoate synthesis regulator protein
MNVAVEGVSRAVGGVMNVLLDNGNEIGRYKGVKMWQNQVRVKAPFLRNVLHMWLSQAHTHTHERARAHTHTHTKC